MKLAEKYDFVLSYLEKAYPTAQSELNFRNLYELLVSVILSAQCTDKRVNMVTPELFVRYPSVQMLSQATPEEVFFLIQSISYPNNKAKYLVGMAQKLVAEFGGEIPSDVDLLQTLPGVGRKTAHVVASVWFGQPVMAVDTHVFRVSERIGLSRNAKNPLQTEQQLMKYIPEDKVATAHHWLILHGRYVCIARSPLCSTCGLTDCCLFFQKRHRS